MKLTQFFSPVIANQIAVYFFYKKQLDKDFLISCPAMISKTLPIVIFLLYFFNQNIHAQTVAFVSNPSALADTITVCTGQSITYTDASTGVVSGQTYNWVFGGGVPSTASTSGPHTIAYSSAGTYTTSLTIGSTTSTRVVRVDPAVTANLLSLTPGGAYNFMGNSFRYCGPNFSGNVPFNFQINNSNYPANSSLSINWGDGQSQVVTLPAASVFHVYNGSTTIVHTMTLTITTFSGCVFVQTYQVYQGSAPTIGVISGSGQDVCIPFDYDFTLISNNVPGTTYTVGFTDLTTPVTLTVPFSSSVTHTFNLSSCGFTASASSTATYLNAFQCGITANNSCGSTSTTIAPIYVSSPPLVSAAISPSNSVCQFDTVNITNTTISTISNSVLGCDTTTYFFWDIQPPVGFNILNNGNLGDSGTFGLSYFQGWTQGSPSLNLEFLNSGVYEVTLVVANGCAFDSITQTITVNPTPIIQDYQETICTGGSFDYSPMNNPPADFVPLGTEYSWTVSSNSNILGGSSGSGTSISDTLVNLTEFPDSLVYTVIPNANGCFGDTFEITIVVLPGVFLPDFTETICNGGSFSYSPVNNPPTVIIPSGTFYTWSVNNNPNVSGESNGSGLSVTDTLTSSILGAIESVVYTVIGQSGSGCSADTFNLTVNINTIAIPSIDSNQTICFGGDPAPIYFITPPVGAGSISYQWQSATTMAAAFTDLVGDTLPTYDPPIGIVDTTVYQVIISSQLNGVTCSIESNGVVVFVNQNPIANAGSDTFLNCYNLSTGVQIGSSSVAGFNYAWTPALGLNNSNSSNPIATEANQYVLTTTNSITGCFSTDSVVVNLNTQPPAVSAGIDDTITCINNAIGVSIGMISSNGNSYNWSPNLTINSATISNPIATPAITTQYLLTVFDSLNGCSASDSVIVYVDTVQPNADAGIDGFILCSSDTLGIPIGSAAISGMDYSWNPNNTLNSPIASNPIATPNSTTNYILTVTNQTNGCSDSDTVLVTVNIDLSTVDAGADLYICSGSSVTLTGSGAATYFWNNGVIDQVPFTPAASASYILTGIDSTGGCQTTDTMMVFVNPIPSMVDPSDQIICNGGSTVDVIFSSSVAGSAFEWVNSNPLIGLSASGTGDILSFNGTNTTNSPLTAILTVAPIFENGGVSCEGDTVSFMITVNPTPTVDTSIDQILCSGDSTAQVQFSSTFGVSGTAYSWTNSNNTIGLSPSSGNGNLPSFSGINPGPSIVSSAIVVTPNYSNLGTTCFGLSDTFTIFVNPIPTVANPSDQLVCNNNSTLDVDFSSSTIGTTFDWVNSNIAIGLPGSGTGDILSFTGINNSNSAITATVTVTATFENGGASCTGDTTTFSFTVNPSLIVVADSSAAYCQNSNTISPIIASSNGSAGGNYIYQWYTNVVNTNTGGSPIANANGSTFLPPTTSIGTNYYYCVISQDTTVENCSFSSNPVGIVVNPEPSFISQPISFQTACLGGTLTSLSVMHQNGIGVPTYQWYSNPANTTIGGVAISGATLSSFMPQSTAVGTSYYYCVVTFALGGCNEIISDISTIVIQPDPTIVVQPVANQAVCVGGTIDSPLFISYSGGVGLPSYQWQQGGVDIFGATDSTYFPSSFAIAGTYDYTVVLTINGSGCDADTSQMASVLVVPDPIITDQPDSANYCQNGTSITPLFVSASGGIGLYNYQWYSNTVNSNVGGILINGATDSVYTPSVGAIGTIFYYCVVTQSGLNCNITSSAAGITTTEVPTFTAQPLATQSLCLGGTSTDLLVSYAGGNSSVNYQWFENTLNSNFGGVPIVGANSNSYTPPSNASGTTYYYCVISFQTGSCSSLVSNTAQVDVVNDLAIDSQPLTSQSICQGTTINSPLNLSYSGGTGGTTISWYQIGTPNVLVSNTSGTLFQPANFNTAGTFEFMAILSAAGSGCDNAMTTYSEIIVNPTPNMDPINDTVICNNSALSVNLNSSVPSNFIWNAIDNINVTGELTLPQTTNAITDSLFNNSTTPQFITYQITPTSFPHNCVGPDSTFVVQVQPDIFLSMQTNIEICSGGPVNAILAANAPSNFEWFVTIDNPNVSGESLLLNSSNIITDILVNNTTVNQMVVYSVHPISSLGSCDGSFQTVTVIVKPPLILLNEDTVTICSGENVNLSLIANTNVSFNWYADQNPNVLNESTVVTSSSLIHDTLVNATQVVQEVLYYVVGTSTGNGCSSQITPIVAYVNPIPSINPITDTILCNGVNLNPIVVSGPVINSVYNWVATSNSIGIPQLNGINTIPGFITSNNSTFIEQSFFTVAPSYVYNNVTCIGSNEQFSISVVPTPIVNSLPDITICNGIQVAQNTLTSPNSNTIFNWSNSNTSISLNSSGIGNVPSFMAVNLTNVDQFSTVTISPVLQAGNVQCSGSSEDYLITVHPTPNVMNTDVEICSGENTNILLSTTIPSIVEWYATPTMSVFNETSFPIQSSLFIDDTLTTTVNTPQVVDYHIIATAIPFGCIGPEAIVTVTVNPLPIVDFTISNAALCDLQSVNFQNTSQGILNYNWDFGNGTTSFLINPTTVYPTTGAFDIQLTATNPFTGCTNFFDSTIVISQTPDANFTFSDSAGCESLEVLFSANVMDPSWSYSWDFGNGETSQQWGSSGSQFSAIGCYDVALTVGTSEGCFSTETENNAICVYHNPVAAFSADNQTFSSLVVPVVHFTNESQFATGFYWQFGDNTTSITENPLHQYYTEQSEYVVILTATNNQGCLDTARLVISIVEDIAIYVPNSFTPNEDEYNQYFLPVLSSGFKKSSYHLTIFDRWGEIVFESFDENFGWDGSYGVGDNLKKCQSGMYTYKITVDVLATGDTNLYMGHVNLIK